MDAKRTWKRLMFHNWWFNWLLNFLISHILSPSSLQQEGFRKCIKQWTTEATKYNRRLLVDLKLIYWLKIQNDEYNFFKWAKPGLFFCLFSFFSQCKDNYSTMRMCDYKWKKRRWHTWNLNRGQQDGRRRRIHCAMAAPLTNITLLTNQW